MNNKIYVGNLNYATTEETLREAFGAHGEVANVHIVTDRYSGRPRGFAFVEMGGENGGEAAAAAIAALNGKSLDGRELKVAEAKPRKNRDRNQRRDNRGGYNNSRW